VSRREFARTLADGALGVVYMVTRVIALSVTWAMEGRKR
jgi:hypothetical protein